MNKYKLIHVQKKQIYINDDLSREEIRIQL